jgi:ketosteroid isomerase-like protein
MEARHVTGWREAGIIMRGTTGIALVVLAALCGAGSCARATRQHDAGIREAITALNDEAVTCYTNAEAECVASFFSEEGLMAFSATPSLGGPEAIRRYWQQAFGWGQYELTLTSQLIEPSEPLAVERGRYVMKFTAGPGAPPNRQTGEDRGTFVTHWRHDPDGRWRVAVQAFVSEVPARVVAAPAPTEAPKTP